MLHFSFVQSVETGGNRKFALLLVGCKADVDKRQVSDSEVRNRASALGCSSILTSAKDRLNVRAAFDEIVREYRRINKTGGDGTTRGYLIKAGSESGIDRSIKSKQRWFKLSGHQLDYWEMEEHESAGKKVVGSLNIISATMTDTDDDLTFKLSGDKMSSKKDKPYYLTAENKDELDKWKAALNWFFEEQAKRCVLRVTRGKYSSCPTPLFPSYVFYLSNIGSLAPEDK